jgi:hypothetical protein
VEIRPSGDVVDLEQDDPDFEFRSPKDADSDQGLLQRNGRPRRVSINPTSVGKDSPLRSLSGRYTHLMQFDLNSEPHILDTDCNCDFWNSLGYKF